MMMMYSGVDFRRVGDNQTLERQAISDMMKGDTLHRSIQLSVQLKLTQRVYHVRALDCTHQH